MDLIERARLLVAGRPAAIEGQSGNATTFGVACVLVWGFGLSPAEALPVMQEYNARCEPPWSERELARMLNSVMKYSHEKPRGYLAEGGKHGTDEATAAPEAPVRKKARELKLDALKAAQDPGLAMDMRQWREWLRDRSPVDPREVTPEQYLDGLYRPGERVLIFNRMWSSQGDYGRVIGERTMELAQTPEGKPKLLQALPPGSPEGMTFLMQPVDGKWHLKGGTAELSRRTKASVTRWPYLLLESDKAPLEMWLNAMVRARIRICSITTSGGRSLHALVRVDKDTEEELIAELKRGDALETLAVLGCDAQALHGMVYPRLPNTWREGKRMGKLDREGKPVNGPNGRRVMTFVPFRAGRAKQALLYFNPSPERGRCIQEGVVFERAGK